MTSDPKTDPGANRRKKTRFAVSPDFRMKVMLALSGEGGTWKDWSGTLVDLSATGAHVVVSLAAVAFPENPCKVKLSFGTFKLDIPGTVAHYVCDARYSTCGVQFDFSNASVEKMYGRVLEPVIASATLAPAGSKADESGRYREEYRGHGQARLVVWREKEGAPISGFEYQLGRYVAELAKTSGEPAALKAALKFKPGASTGTSSPLDFLSHNQEQDARWQFSLAASNLPKILPAEERKFFLSLA